MIFRNSRIRLSKLFGSTVNTKESINTEKRTHQYSPVFKVLDNFHVI